MDNGYCLGPTFTSAREQSRTSGAVAGVELGAEIGAAGGPPGAVVGAVIGGLIGLGATYLAAKAIADANSKAQGQLKDADATQTCTTCEPPECSALSAAIKEVTNELKKRYPDLRRDDRGPFPIRPEKLPNVGSWNGHIQQFENKQSNLRKLLQEAQAKGCSVPPNAWAWASREPPTQPAP